MATLLLKHTHFIVSNNVLIVYKANMWWFFQIRVKFRFVFGERINCYLVTTGHCDYSMKGVILVPRSSVAFGNVVGERHFQTSSTVEENVSPYQLLLTIDNLNKGCGETRSPLQELHPPYWPSESTLSRIFLFLQAPRGCLHNKRAAVLYCFRHMLGSISAALSCLVRVRGRSAGSFPEQRLVIEPSHM